jgi:hypothetical protein
MSCRQGNESGVFLALCLPQIKAQLSGGRQGEKTPGFFGGVLLTLDILTKKPTPGLGTGT